VTFRGIGFKTADAIAMKLGIEKTAMIRVRAGISYALTELWTKATAALPTGATHTAGCSSCLRCRRSWS